MTKILAHLAISFSALMASGLSAAAPQIDSEFESNSTQSSSKPQKKRTYQENAPDQNDERRSREERGLKRLHQMKWQTGYVMPQHYRSDGYKVEYKQYNLPKPNRNQQWYKINNSYILLDAESNNIVKIQRQ